MADGLTEAVRKAIDALPVSRREIARRAGLAHTTLNRIAHDRQQATLAIARRVADALGQLGGEVDRARDVVLTALNNAPEEE